jgi:ClpP class serine protease
MKKNKLKVVFHSLWDTATEEQKKEYQQRIDDAYDIIFEEVLKKKSTKYPTLTFKNNYIR